jgi:hypothetical protein
MNSMKPPIAEKYIHRVPLVLPGFEKFCAIGAPRYDAPAIVLADRARDSAEWYREFRDRLFGQLETECHFPIYRMGDGEYSVLVGHQDGAAGKARRFVSSLLSRRMAHKSGTPAYGFEQYTYRELAQVRERLPGLLRHIAAQGVLAAALHPENPGFSRFIRPVFGYFEKHEISFGPDSYVPFYFVYAILCGPDCKKLLQGRKILVVSSNTRRKFELLKPALEARGASDVSFLECSAEKAMFDVLDLGGVAQRPDIVLLGAGIGAANILEQLAPLRSLCIDSGYCLTVLGNPHLPRRAYAMMDTEWNPALLADVPGDVVGK